MNKSVLILGGGIAGLSAAAELVRNGCTVTILEAKERLGGRIHTIDGGGFPIELGAEFLHGQSKPLLNAIRAGGLSTQPVSSRNQLFENGHLQPVELWEKIGEIIKRVNARSPDCSFRDFLNGQNLDERSRRMALGFVEGFDAAHPERISAHALLRAEEAAEEMEGAQQERIKEGYSALVSFLEQEVRTRGGRLMMGTAARTVRWKHGRVEVAAQSGAGTEAFEADAMVITLPLGLLKTRAATFDPPLPDKEEAISRLQFGNVVKVILVFRERWWSEPNFGFIHAFEETIPTWWSDPRGPVLTGWAGGPKADALLTHSTCDLEALALRILEKIFRTSSLRDKMRAAHTYGSVAQFVGGIGKI